MGQTGVHLGLAAWNLRRVAQSHLHRGGWVDGNGTLIDSWTQWDRLFEGGGGPHKIKISPYDPERHVWVANDARQVIYEFTNDGKRLVRTLHQFAVDAEGNLYTADSFGGRVQKFKTKPAAGRVRLVPPGWGPERHASVADVTTAPSVGRHGPALKEPVSWQARNRRSWHPRTLSS